MPVPQISCTECDFVAGVSSSNTHVCPSCHAATPPLTLQPPLMTQAPPTQCHPETRSYRRPPMRSATLHGQAIKQEELAKMGLFYVPCNASPTPQAPEYQIRRSIPQSPPYYPPHFNAQIDADAAGQSTSTLEGKTEDDLPQSRSFLSFRSPLDRRTPSFLSDEGDDELTAPVFREHPTMSLEETLRRRTEQERSLRHRIKTETLRSIEEQFLRRRRNRERGCAITRVVEDQAEADNSSGSERISFIPAASVCRNAETSHVDLQDNQDQDKAMRADSVDGSGKCVKEIKCSLSEQFER